MLLQKTSSTIGSLKQCVKTVRAQCALPNRVKFWRKVEVRGGNVPVFSRMYEYAMLEPQLIQSKNLVHELWPSAGWYVIILLLLPHKIMPGDNWFRGYSL